MAAKNAGGFFKTLLLTFLTCAIRQPCCYKNKTKIYSILQIWSYILYFPSILSTLLPSMSPISQQTSWAFTTGALVGLALFSPPNMPRDLPTCSLQNYPAFCRVCTAASVWEIGRGPAGLLVCRHGHAPRTGRPSCQKHNRFSKGKEI